MDDSQKHDPLKVNEEENEAMDEQMEEMTGSSEVEAAEESAMNIDTDIAREATEATEGESEEATDQLEKEAELVDQAVERKHKGRESTSEKAKRAAAERVAKGQTAEPVAAKALDPLRLRGKKYRAMAILVEKDKEYPLEEAIELVKKTSYASFDAAVELHCKVKSENVRGTLTLPHGSGKTKRVAVADDETIEAIAAGALDFDVLVATPSQMPKLARFAKVLGPKGLMPSPKAGTVGEDVEKIKNEIGGGRIEYRADKTGIVHASVGRVSFSSDKLAENVRTLEQALTASKILSLVLSATMGPGVRVAKS